MKTLAVKMQRWAETLKFKLVALAVTFGLPAAATTAALVTRTLDNSMKKMVLAEAQAAVSGTPVG